ncbi:ATP-binding cassette domain-containing protein [Collinsella tanakaei]|uniref:ATP-binding cassette domain-containing protein n=1 Tax=Collinsella tanakaei TaxID=626935 RepID=UPI00195A960D|nr:ATP-binding cassette domain-containing protein [Collinsella tanakaei]MBM6778842.1 ATP-binding cassette domain-containing protein [Collinsella tanakaei]
MERKGYEQPSHIQVRGARVHNLKNIDVDIPLGQLVGIAGVSGSGKSSLALGTLYAEGSRRYLDALSTYTRRRIAQTGRATVDEVLHVPAALALRQRPGIPGVHSTFGTSTELLNYLRLLFSRLGSHVCPNGHRVPPSMDVALGQMTTCPICGVQFMGPGAEDLAFNSGGACPTCGGTGIVRTVDEATLVPDESISIDDGAVLPWGSLMWDLMKQVCGAMGVRTNVPFCELTPEERDIVFHGPAVKKHILYQPKKGNDFAELDFTYFNAVYTVENALSKAKDEKGLARVSKFLREDVCPDCHGTRLSERARGPQIGSMTLADATALTLDELAAWVPTVPATCPDAMRAMAQTICAEMAEPIERLQQLGLGYLSLDRASSTLSTGERQRVQLARAVRNRTCGVLYVLDEPSIGLHPSNVEGLLGVVDDLLADGNSVVLVDHDVRVLRQADHLIEIGPGSGADGGRIIAQGTVAEVEASPETRIGPFLSGARSVRVRERAAAEHVFANGAIHLDTDAIHTVKPLSVDIPRGRLTAVTGVSGSGKTTLVLESLIPGLRAAIAGEALPAHVRSVEADGILRANLIDATPIGANVRSTVGTYSGVLDDLRRAYAKLPEARERGLKAGAFSYNTGSLRCPTCDGTGQISLDVQFLPDVDIPCPDCGGARYGRAAYGIKLAGDISLPELLSYTVDQALEVLADTNLRTAKAKLQVLHDLGLGYLTLGEATPALSGGEAQRLKLASELTRKQGDALFVFDEPTIGLHPLDVEVLLRVLQRLIDNGATVVVIEHDLDMIANADYVIDMGPGGGDDGGRIVCAGTPEQVAAYEESITGRYIAEELR